MNIDEKESYCPYCGESISLLVDNSIENQEYIEDCQVCCSPILISIENLKQGDALLIAGKGHEVTQIIGDTIFPFNDVEQASMAIEVLENGPV